MTAPPPGLAAAITGRVWSRLGRVWPLLRSLSHGLLSTALLR